MNNKQLRFIWATIQPSLFSSAVTILLCGIVLLTAMLSYSARSGLIYDFLFGPNSSTELIQTSKGSFTEVTTNVLGNPILNKAVFYMFWMFVGLVVYTILSSLIRGATTAAEDIQESQNINDTKGENLKTIRSRFLLRLIVLVGWLLYTIFFVKIILPYSVLTSRIGVSGFPTLIGCLYIFAGVIILFIGLHIHTISARLFVLKLRVFNSEEVEELADSGE